MDGCFAVLQFYSSSLCSSFYIFLVQLFSYVERFGGAFSASVCHCRFVVLLFYVSDIKKAVEQLFLPPTYSIKQDKQNADCTILLYIAVRAAALDVSRV